MPDRQEAGDGGPVPAPGAIDRQVAASLRNRRERLGKSLADIAGAMVSGGWDKFYPQTISRIEHGERKVSVGEGEALARILGTTLTRLQWAEGEDAAVSYGEQAIGNLRRAASEVASAVAQLHAAQAGAEVALRSLRADSSRAPSARVTATADTLEEELDGASLENAVDEGEARWERLQDGEGDSGAC
jgi:transcriptional regulator with XRE-family HTH domain